MYKLILSDEKFILFYLYTLMVYLFPVHKTKDRKE